MLSLGLRNRPLTVTRAGTTTTCDYVTIGPRLKRTVRGKTTPHLGSAKLRNRGGTALVLNHCPHPRFRIVTPHVAPSTAYIRRNHLASIRMVTLSGGT